VGAFKKAMIWDGVQGAQFKKVLIFFLNCDADMFEQTTKHTDVEEPDFQEVSEFV
jgi:hypothetical protein